MLRLIKRKKEKNSSNGGSRAVRGEKSPQIRAPDVETIERVPKDTAATSDDGAEKRRLKGKGNLLRTCNGKE